MATQASIAQSMISQLRILDPSISAAIGTPERMIIDTVANVIAESQVDMNILQGSFDIDAKMGTDLDNMLSLFGFGRQQGTRSTGYVTFFREGAAPADILIRKGTQVKAPGASTDGRDVIFYTSSDAILLQNMTQVVVPIEASVAGDFANVAANTIVETYGSPIIGITSLNNDYPTVGGTLAETDDQLKARFKATGPFRNISGTESQYLATAIASLAKKAIVIGPVSKQREYFQIPLNPDNDGSGNSSVANQYTTALSSNDNAKYVYDNNYYVINESTSPATHYRENFDFVFNSVIGEESPKNKGDAYREYIASVPGALDPTSSDADGKPNFTFTNVFDSSNSEVKPDTAIAPGDVVLTEYSYLSTASRNDYEMGVMNCVDVYVNNSQDKFATVTIPRPGLGVPTFTFTSDNTEAFYIDNFRRMDEPEHRPIVGNIFTPLYHQPSGDVPASIEISDTTFYKGTHYWPVEDITSIGKTIRSRNGIEWSSTIKGQRTASDNSAGPFTGQLILAGNIVSELTNVKGKTSKTGDDSPLGDTAFIEGDGTFDLKLTENVGVTKPVEGMFISGTGIAPGTIIQTVGTSSLVSWSGYSGQVVKYPITLGLKEDLEITKWGAIVTTASSSGTSYTYTTSNEHMFTVGSTVTVTGSDILDYNVTDATIVSVSTDGFSFTVIGGTSGPAVPSFTNGFAKITTHKKYDYVYYEASSDENLTKTYCAKSAITTASTHRTYPPAYKITGVTATGTNPNKTYTYTLELINGATSNNLSAGQTVRVIGTTNFNGKFTVATKTNNTFTVTGQTTSAANESSLNSAVVIDTRYWAEAGKAIGTGDVTESYLFGYPVYKNSTSIYVPSSYDWPTSGTIQIGAEKINYASGTFTTLVDSDDTIVLENLNRGQSGTIVSDHPIGSSASLYDSAVDTYLNIENYIYDNNVQVLQGALDGVKQITTDVLAHQATLRYFKPDVTVMLSPGVTRDQAKKDIRSALLNYFQGQYFGSTVQLSDILQIIHNTTGIDNVRWSRDSFRSWISGKDYAKNSYVIDNDVVYYSQYGTNYSSISVDKTVPPSDSSPLSYGIVSATSSGTHYTYTLDEDHEFNIGDMVKITGSNLSAYNGDFQIIDIEDLNTITVIGPSTDPGSPEFYNSGLVVSINWVVADPRNKLTETNANGTPIIEAILDKVVVGGDGVNKTKYHFYFPGLASDDSQPKSGKIKIKVTDINFNSSYAEIDIGNIAFKTSVSDACNYVKSEINGAFPNLVETVTTSSDQKIPDVFNQFEITFSNSNRTEELSVSNLSLVGNFGSYNYDFDLKDNELITLPNGDIDEEMGILNLDTVLTVRFKSQSTWNVE